MEKPGSSLSEKEKAVMRKTEECTAGAQDLQQVVQFPHSYHLLLQVHLGVQVVTLKITDKCINHSITIMLIFT